MLSTLVVIRLPALFNPTEVVVLDRFSTSPELVIPPDTTLSPPLGKSQANVSITSLLIGDEQSAAKLLKLKSMARQNKKHWDKLKNFLI